MMIYKKEDFCCAEMYHHLIGPDGDGCELHFGYNTRFREYFIDYRETAGGGVQLIKFCPWCGRSLPKSLDSEFYDELSKATGILEDELDFYSYLNPSTPKEFHTDEWWRKRNL